MSAQRHAWRGHAARWRAGVMGVVLLIALAVIPTALANAFVDVSAEHPYAVAINELADQGIIVGYDTANGTEFRPQNPVLRAQFAKMICGALRIPVTEQLACPFTDLGQDVADNFYPHEFVAAAWTNGITTGVTPTSFEPYRDISRAQVISMVVRAADNLRPGKLVAPAAGYQSTWDPSFSPTHGQNARTAEYNGLLQGLALASLDPWGKMPRGEVAHILFNLQRKVDATTATTTTTAPVVTTTTLSPTTTTLLPGTTTTTAPVPAVVAAVPNPGAMNVDARQSVSATFSVPMNTASLNTTTFTLRRTGGSSVAGTVSYESTARRATFVAGATLVGEAEYEATLTTGVRSAAGVPLAGQYSWTFRTAPAPVPHALLMLPLPGMIRVPVTTKIVVLFDARMDPSTVGPTSFVLARRGGGSYGCSIEWDIAKKEVTFTPSVVLPGNSMFDVTVTTDVKSDQGVPLAQPLTWSFTTAKEELWTDQVVGNHAPEAIARPNRINVFWPAPEGVRRFWYNGSWQSGLLPGSLSPGAYATNSVQNTYGADQPLRTTIFVRGSGDSLKMGGLSLDAVAFNPSALGLGCTSDPAAVCDAPGRLHVFFRGTSNELKHLWWNNAIQQWVTDVTVFPGTLTSSPTAVSWASDRLDIFARGPSGELLHWWWSGSSWGQESLGGSITSVGERGSRDPVAVSMGYGLLDIFARRPDNQLGRWSYNGSTWSYEALGGNLTSRPDALSWYSGHLDVFWRGVGGALWHTWRSGGGWSSPESLGGQLAQAPSVCSWGPNRIDAFGTTDEGYLWHRWFDGSW